jgi:signal transduction histidine kinase
VRAPTRSARVSCEFGVLWRLSSVMSTTAQILTDNTTVLIGSTITLSVISYDADLIALCREVLRELGEADALLDLELSSDSRKIPNAEVCLLDWDCRPADRTGYGRTFYLVAPSEIEALLEEMPTAEGNILLKPVTRAVLRAFLRSVISTRDGAVGSDVESLRADRDDILQCLLQANLRLQEYDQQRTNFIARAVHDFRAPLTALSGFCGLLASGQLGPLSDEQKEALERMEHSAKRISRMASAMFDLSIGPKTNPKPDLREGDIRERIKQAMHEILPLARDKQISVQATDILAPAQPLYFESTQIEQVLLNLLDNACKFTQRKGKIEVSGYPYFWERRFLSGTSSVDRRVASVRTPNSYRVDIKDTGPGVPPELLSHIFEEYTSYAGSQDRSGGGLGLAICRLIMNRHQGHIWAETFESGASFSFVLPHRRAESQGNISRSRGV